MENLIFIILIKILKIFYETSSSLSSEQIIHRDFHNEYDEGSNDSLTEEKKRRKIINKQEKTVFHCLIHEIGSDYHSRVYKR